ncbi:MAG: DNA polymerase III subunit alpha [Omnitrophica WOR_2 bacterium SM23_29]|nr:MAG: DNA polymerase III subunit alpha [Omnitrophica WOR_2 bacterium SM23_29]
MIHSDYVHLHVHSQYSLLDGACLISDLINLSQKYKMPALALTDHGNMFGAIEFYSEAMAKGVKPIIGCEVYIAPGSRFEKSSHGIQEASFHLILLAKDEVGYKSLLKLVSLGYLEGFYYRPRIDKELLSQYSKGLIALTSCLQGEIPYLLVKGKYKEAKEVTSYYKDIFGAENFYLELQENLIPEQDIANKGILRLAAELDIPIVATADIHYISKRDAQAHEALLCIQTQTTLGDPNHMRFQTDEFYFKSPDEMKQLFAELPQAISSTLEITEKCNLELEFDKTHLPHFNPPQEKTREEYLRELVEAGLKKCYRVIDETVRNRVEHELKIIKDTGFTSYFLIAWDFIHYAKSKGIPVGPGRGSAAGSVVSYALGITDLDPLKYDLIFERFLNPERVGLPDIDIDFCYERRGEVINYVIEKYSKDNVAQIITFGTMQTRAVIRDVGRVMGLSYGEVDRIAKLVPPDPNITLEEAINGEPELRNLYKKDPKITQLIDTSLSLEGLTRHASTHAAGVVISDEPLTNYIPLFKAGEDQISTGYSMSSLEKIGLLKMDFLGLRTLTVIDETVKIIKRTKGIDIDIENISMDDPKTFALLSHAESLGVFQLESAGMRELLRKLRPNKFEDIVAILALYRPGPIGSGMVDDFIKRKHGLIPIKYDHKLLEPILKETYGIIVYQEQVMRIASDLAGFTMSQADSLRRAMSKKTPEVMEQARTSFIEGATKKGIEKRTAEKVFNLIEYFAGYGFNKSHSTAYALISYRTAYLKANYPVEFMTALLTSERDNIEKVAFYIEETQRIGIKILPPDVNESFAKFTVIGDTVRFGLSAVKNVGQGAIDSIITARSRIGKFKSLYELCEHVDPRLVNRKVLESLIKCGAMDEFGLHRSQLTAILEDCLETASVLHKERQNGQLSFFPEFGAHLKIHSRRHDIPKIAEWPETQLLAYEKEMLGFYITGHPLAKYERLLKTYVTTLIKDLGKKRAEEEVILGGIITKVKFTTTKAKNEKMAIINLEDLSGQSEVLVFPSAYTTTEKFIRKDAIVCIKGKVNLREEKPKLIANNIIPLEELQKKYTQAIIINLTTTGIDEKSLTILKSILESHPGTTPVYLNFKMADGKKVEVSVEEKLKVEPSDELAVEIERLLGGGTVSFKT